MHLGIRAKLFLLSVVLITVGLFGAYGYAARALARDLRARVHTDLQARIDLASNAISAARAFEPRTADSLVRQLAASSAARFTLIDARGVVVADSALPLDRVAHLESHADRPEVQAARETGHGVSERASNTLRQPLIYVARRLNGPDGEPWVLRLAIAPRQLATSDAEMRHFLIIGSLIGLLAAAVLSSLAAHLLAQRVRRLTDVARAMVGDLSVRAHMRTTDEVGVLAGVLDDLAEGLEVSLGNLARERDRLRAILEAMAEGVVVTGAEGSVILANRALREMFLVGRDIVGQTPIEALRNAELHDAIAEATRAGTPVSHEFAVRGVRPRRVLAHIAPLDGTAGTVAVLFDVTDLRRLETVRRDFVANVSHELRTPIAAVRAAAETLQEGALNDPDAALEFVAVIDRHAARLHQLVEDLLALSRIEAKEVKLTLEPVVLRTAVEHVLDLLRLPAEKKKIHLAATVAQSLPSAHADPRALEQILLNLIDNAIKYSPSGATVTLRAAAHEDNIRVSVQDTGPGIEAKHLPRLFERFYRVDAGRSRQVGGTGLGLAIVKHLAEEMGATVSVESTVGRGSVFHINLRVHSHTQPQPSATTAA